MPWRKLFSVCYCCNMLILMAFGSSAKQLHGGRKKMKNIKWTWVRRHKGRLAIIYIFHLLSFLSRRETVKWLYFPLNSPFSFLPFLLLLLMVLHRSNGTTANRSQPTLPLCYPNPLQPFTMKSAVSTMEEDAGKERPVFCSVRVHLRTIAMFKEIFNREMIYLRPRNAFIQGNSQMYMNMFRWLSIVYCRLWGVDWSAWKERKSHLVPC